MTERDTIESLACRAAKGDREAFDELVEIYGPRIAGLARASLGRRALGHVDVADVVQETFAKAFQHIDRLQWKGERAFFAWLAALTQNVVLSTVRKVRHAPLQLEVDPPRSAPSPSKNLRREERLDRLHGALEALSPDHREVIQLARLEKLQVKEIASRMGRSPNAIKKLLSRALDELRKRFGYTESLHLPEAPSDSSRGGPDG